MFNFMMFGISFSVLVFAGALVMGLFVFPRLGINPIIGLVVVVAVASVFIVWLLRKTIHEKY